MSSSGHGETTPRAHHPHPAREPATPTHQPRRNTIYQKVTESAPAKSGGSGFNMSAGLNPRAPDFGGRYIQGLSQGSPHNTPTKQAPSAASVRGMTLSTLPTVREVETPPPSAVGVNFKFPDTDSAGTQDTAGNSGQLRGGRATPGSDGSGAQTHKQAGSTADAGTRGGSPASTSTGHLTQSTGNLNLSETPKADSSRTVSGCTIIKIADERNHFRAITPANGVVPMFLSHIPDTLNPDVYRTQVIPFLQAAVFVITSMADLHYFRELLSVTTLPNLWLAVTAIDFPAFHWFSGISKERPSNPYLGLATTLPNLTEIKLSFHTAGLTASALPERERIRLENMGQVEESKTLKVLRCNDVVKFYGLLPIFNLRALKVIKIDCIQSDMVTHYCRGRDPMATWNELIRWIVQGYLDANGRLIGIESQVIPPPKAPTGGFNAGGPNASG